MASVSSMVGPDEWNRIRRAMGMEPLTGKMRRFHIQRHMDVSGVSGIGRVAEGVQFSDGSAAMRWLSDTPTTVNAEGGAGWLVRIHGHGGSTELVWDDPE